MAQERSPRSHRPFRFEHWWTRPNFSEMYSRNINKSLYLNEIWIYGPFFCTLFLPGFEPGTSRIEARSANHYTNVERAGLAKKLMYMKFFVIFHCWATDWAITKILISNQPTKKHKQMLKILKKNGFLIIIDLLKSFDQHLLTLVKSRPILTKVGRHWPEFSVNQWLFKYCLR